VSNGKVTNVNYILENGIKILKGLPLVEISRLKRHPNNIKKHPKEQIKNLMELMKIIGFKDPIVIDKKENVKAGHGRLDAAEKLGMTRVPYIPLEGLTKKQMDLFMYMDNQVNESPWIEDNVQLLLEDISLPDLNTFEVNWDDVIISDPQEETLEIPEPPITPKSKLGQIYQLGNHRVMCGDNQNPENYSKLLDSKKISQLNTDPPYGVLYGEKNAYLNKLDGGNRIEKQYENDELDCDYNKMFNVIFDNIPFTDYNTVYIWSGGQKLDQLKNTMEECGLKFSQYLIWIKNNHVLGRQDYSSKNEFCIYGWKKHHKFYGGFRTNLLEYDKPLANKLHPTQKPPELIAQTITDGTKKDDIVLDVFLGSGSTLIACEQTNRVCYGMEIDPGYVDVIITRFINFKGSDDDVYLIKDNKKIKWRDL